MLKFVFLIHIKKLVTMKKVLSFLGMAILGGGIALGGYKLFLEKPVVVERTVDNSLPVVQSNFTETTTVNTPTNFTEAAEKTVNAVVHVKNTAIKSAITTWADLFNGPRRYEQIGTGSGVIISSDGYIVTNNHVITNASDLEITLNNSKKYKAELVGTDEKNDIALLKINADSKLPYMPFANSDNIRIGEWVLAVGNPYNLTSTVTAGIVSAKGRDLKGNGDVTDSFIQTDAAVNPGNSGGALVNVRGELVGINTAISSQTGSYVGYSFAVPSNIAKKIVDDILEFGSVQEAVLGISVDNSQQDVEGVKIGSLPEDSGAKKAGLEEGDIIVKINNVKITKFSDLAGQLTAKRPGDRVDVTVDRSGNYLTKNVVLSKRDTYFSRPLRIQLKDLTKKEKKKFDIESGAKISRSLNESLTYSGIEEGDILISVNKRKVLDASDAARLLDNAYKSRTSIVLEIMNKKGETERYIFR